MFDWVAASQPREHEQYQQRQWTRCSRQRHCPVCGKPDWCSVDATGEAALCMRVSDGSALQMDLGHGTGYLHELPGTGKPAAPELGPIPVSPHINWGAAMARWAQYTTDEQLNGLAASLGVSRQAVDRMDTRWCPERRAWAFPMHDHKRQIIGVRIRSDDGSKFAIRNSRSGLFIPSGLDSKSQLLVCEGPTDTAAALTLGYGAIGIPSAGGGASILAKLLECGRRRELIIVSDLDGPGMRGARSLAARMVGLCASVKIITAAPHKDLRKWLNAGLKYDVLAVRIANAVVSQVHHS